MEGSSRDEHDQAISHISSRMRSFYDKQVPFRIYHGSTNSTQHRKVDPDRMIDTSQLKHVFNIDKERKTCLSEPNVAMDELVEIVAKHGLLPPVVMEFPGITVGGGFAGTAGESSGFKEGFFDRTVNWIEMVLADGEVVRASPTERPDLFYGAAGTLGTLGVTTLLEIRLVGFRPYVELTYHPVTSVTDALATTKACTKVSSNDFVDGILFAMNRGVIISGKLVDKIPPGGRLQRFNRAHDPWFYIHIDRAASRQIEPLKEYTPIRDYLFRYDRGAVSDLAAFDFTHPVLIDQIQFWTGKYAFEYFITPFNRITRWALDYFMHTRVMYHALHASGHASKYIVQDLLLPESTAGEFIDFVNTKFGFWPLWLCPLKFGEKISMHPKVIAGDAKEISFVNVGVWGPGPTTYPKFVEVNRQLEDKVRELGGIKWLYAQAYYTEEEFWEIYDKNWYDALREKYRATHLPTVYQKVKVDLSSVSPKAETWHDWLKGMVWNMWPVSGVYGVLKVLYEREYLLGKQSR